MNRDDILKWSMSNHEKLLNRYQTPIDFLNETLRDFFYVAEKNVIGFPKDTIKIEDYETKRIVDVCSIDGRYCESVVVYTDTDEYYFDELPIEVAEQIVEYIMEYCK